jgi:N-acetylmuramate 1-kinase
MRVGGFEKVKKAVQPPQDLLDAASRSRVCGNFGKDAFSLTRLGGDGSSRCFFRMKCRNSSESFVVMWNPPVNNAALRENSAYERIGRHLKSRGVPVPEIHDVDPRYGCFIMEDLGDVSLQEYLIRLAAPLPLLERVVEVLFHLQHEGAEGFNPRWCCQTPVYDRTVMILLESGYFREAFLSRYLGMTEDLSRLDCCFAHCAEVISGCRKSYLLHRDFQSRNIMISKGRIRIIDWQGARIGPPGYDLASLVIDPYTELTDDQRSFLFEAYLSMLRERFASEVENFLEIYPYLALQRNMQILGAFAYLSNTKGKKEFEAYIPPAVKRLKAQLERMPDNALSPLKEVASEIEIPVARESLKNEIDTNLAGQ